VKREPDVEAALRAVVTAGGDAAAVRAWLDEWGHDERLLLDVLQRQVPVRLLEHLGATRPWCDRPLVAGALARHPRTPAHVALRLLPALFWRDLAQVAAGPYLPGVVRVRAEALLVERLPDLRLGDKIALARLATPAPLRALLGESDGRILEAALVNPRLAEDTLLALLRAPSAPRALLEQAAASTRWRASYAVRRELVLQPRTPLALALAQITSLVRGDLLRVTGSASLAPLVRAAAEAALEAPRGSRREPVTDTGGGPLKR
jgi:hypothetical protein